MSVCAWVHRRRDDGRSGEDGVSEGERRSRRGRVRVAGQCDRPSRVHASGDRVRPFVPAVPVGRARGPCGVQVSAGMAAADLGVQEGIRYDVAAAGLPRDRWGVGYCMVRVGAGAGSSGRGVRGALVLSCRRSLGCRQRRYLVTSCRSSWVWLRRPRWCVRAVRRHCVRGWWRARCSGWRCCTGRSMCYWSPCRYSRIGHGVPGGTVRSSGAGSQSCSAVYRSRSRSLPITGWSWVECSGWRTTSADRRIGSVSAGGPVSRYRAAGTHISSTTRSRGRGRRSATCLSYCRASSQLRRCLVCSRDSPFGEGAGIPERGCSPQWSSLSSRATPSGGVSRISYGFHLDRSLGPFYYYPLLAPLCVLRRLGRCARPAVSGVDWRRRSRSLWAGAAWRPWWSCATPRTRDTGVVSRRQARRAVGIAAARPTAVRRRSVSSAWRRTRHCVSRCLSRSTTPHDALTLSTGSPAERCSCCAPIAGSTTCSGSRTTTGDQFMSLSMPGLSARDPSGTSARAVRSRVPARREGRAPLPHVGCGALCRGRPDRRDVVASRGGVNRIAIGVAVGPRGRVGHPTLDGSWFECDFAARTRGADQIEVLPICDGRHHYAFPDGATVTDVEDLAPSLQIDFVPHVTR